MTLTRESPLEEIYLIITPAEVQLFSKMRNKTKSKKPSDNKTGKNAKSTRVRNFKCNGKT